MNYYTDTFEKMAKKMLFNSRERITVLQTHNFIYYDLVPFMKGIEGKKVAKLKKKFCNCVYNKKKLIAKCYYCDSIEQAFK